MAARWEIPAGPRAAGAGMTQSADIPAQMTGGTQSGEWQVEQIVAAEILHAALAA